MDDFNIKDALNSLLSDPETGDKLSSLLSSLTSESSEDKESAPSQDTTFPDIGMIMKMKELFDSASKETDTHTALLTSLKPYLSEERSKNLDTLMKMLKIYKLINKVKDTSLLKELF